MRERKTVQAARRRGVRRSDVDARQIGSAMGAVSVFAVVDGDGGVEEGEARCPEDCGERRLLGVLVPVSTTRWRQDGMEGSNYWK